MSRTDTRSRLEREEDSWGREEGGAHHRHHHHAGGRRRRASHAYDDDASQSHDLRPVLYGALALAAAVMGKREFPQLKRYLKIERM